MTIEERCNRRVYGQKDVRSLFDSIAHRYDLLNHILSSGIDILWRRRAIQMLQPLHPRRILDVATGTADLAIAAIRLNPEQIIGIDISSKMLEIGKKKTVDLKLDNIITLEPCEAESIRYDLSSFDVVMTAFGVRNFENLERGLAEFHRVLRIGGVTMILEFSKPRRFIVKQLYSLYSNRILPYLGGMVSNNRPAYEYLPSTVAEFPDGEEFCSILRSVGFSKAVCYPQTFGIASIYIATKEQ